MRLIGILGGMAGEACKAIPVGFILSLNVHSKVKSTVLIELAGVAWVGQNFLP
jgi:hypothetical protein